MLVEDRLQFDRHSDVRMDSFVIDTQASIGHAYEWSYYG